MALRLHELHPSLVHAPLALLPSAAVVDLLAVTGKDRHLDRFGATLWWSTCASALAAGLAGMAASQEIKGDEKAKEMMFVHGFGNVVLLVGAVGLASWRSRNRATWSSALLGLSASGAAIYTAYLGGELVYARGVGVKALPGDAAHGVSDSPPVLSREAPWRFVKDAVKGAGWLFARAGQALTSRDRVKRDQVAPGPASERATVSEGKAPGEFHAPH
jgi:uncharacterized membrane protein